MKNFFGRQQAVTNLDVIELALGTPPALWLGEDGESTEERAARLDAAADILDTDPDLYDRSLHAAADLLEAHPHLATLPGTAPRTSAAVLPLRAPRTAHYGTTGVDAA
ncbi:hypothetical protein [Streptomyces benahoarensis]|uniref:hypothetical protein n=1 Tax=Streptomyces benahoarensis TaxID=2595054 RepID=UPI00163D593B|nr:hypothetical protein [Streptomyces benahoarensis]